MRQIPAPAKESAEEKIRIVLQGLRAEDSIAELCRREGISQNLYYRWSKEFLEAGRRRLATVGLGRPLRFQVTGRQVSDHAGALPLLAGLSATHVIADRAYDAGVILDAIEAAGAAAVPHRQGRHRPPGFDPVLYRLRSQIERALSRLKQFRWISTRCNRLPDNYRAGLCLASTPFWCP
jgi:transposase